MRLSTINVDAISTDTRWRMELTTWYAKAPPLKVACDEDKRKPIVIPIHVNLGNCVPIELQTRPSELRRTGCGDQRVSGTHKVELKTRTR